jgi:hypothetical protein
MGDWHVSQGRDGETNQPPAMPFAQSLKGRLVGFAIDSCQASNRLDGQTMLRQGFVDKPF